MLNWNMLAVRFLSWTGKMYNNKSLKNQFTLLKHRYIRYNEFRRLVERDSTNGDVTTNAQWWEALLMVRIYGLLKFNMFSSGEHKMTSVFL